MNAMQRNVRVSLSLVGLTLFVFFVASLLDILPDDNKTTLRSRVDYAETLAVQLSVVIENNNTNIIPVIIERVAKRNPAVLSIALRNANGEMLASFGEPTRYIDSAVSTTNHMKAPIFKDGVLWNIVEVNFRPIQETYLGGLISSGDLRSTAFIAVFGFIVYYLLVSKVVRHVDPFQAIPGRVKTALDSLAEGVVLIDEDEQVVLSNKAFESNFRLDARQLMGKELSSLSWCNPDAADKDENILPWKQTLVDGKSHRDVKLNYKTEADDHIMLVVNSSPLKDGRDNVRGALISFSDVTELEKINHELESMTNFLRHEMHNALVGATGSVALLEKREHLSEGGKELVDRTQRLHRVIKHLLESVREARNIESTFRKESAEPVRIDLLMAGAVQNYSGIYKDNEFVFESDGKELVVLGQEERIIQMLDKLATNAVDHGKAGTPIIFSSRKDKNQAVISVVNEGNPLPQDKRKMFDLFASFRNEKSEKENQGIGLYVVKLIVENYGGSVEARDRKDMVGAEFVIKLPVV